MRSSANTCSKRWVSEWISKLSNSLNPELTDSQNSDLDQFTKSRSNCIFRRRARPPAVTILAQGDEWVSEWVCLNWHKRKWKLLWLLPPYPNHKYPLECPILHCLSICQICCPFLLMAICLEIYGIHTEMGRMYIHIPIFFLNFFKRLNKRVFSMFSLD